MAKSGIGVMIELLVVAIIIPIIVGIMVSSFASANLVSNSSGYFWNNLAITQGEYLIYSNLGVIAALVVLGVLLAIMVGFFKKQGII